MIDAIMLETHQKTRILRCFQRHSAVTVTQGTLNKNKFHNHTDCFPTKPNKSPGVLAICTYCGKSEIAQTLK